MSAVGRSSLFVNARVHLPGARSRATVLSHNVEYIATRPGADRAPTPDDERRAELSERMRIAGYVAMRPGSTALFDQDGAVSLAEARRRLAAADGALSTWVISVRREEAGDLHLGDKAEWQRFLRRELQPALAEAMGVPESSVRWVAAEHENAAASKHVHVIAYTCDGSFDRLMSPVRLAEARRALTDSALEPAIRAAMAERDLARRQAVDAVRRIDPSEISVELPPDGRVSYEHLRRWHPSVASGVEAELHRLGECSSEVSESLARYEAAVARYADLKGLEGDARARYVDGATREMESRRANALLRSIAPDRTKRPRPRPAPSLPPSDGPARRRATARRLAAEARACLGDGGVSRTASSLERGRVPERGLSVCPSFKALGRAITPAIAHGMLSAALRAAEEDRGSNTGDEAEHAARVVGNALLAGLSAAGSGNPEVVAAVVSRELVKGMIV